MDEIILNREQRRTIFKAIKPIFKTKLGKYTHQRISDDWHFLGLGFVREDMTYVFGINVGFYTESKELDIPYKRVGMNLLVRTNGINKDLRKKYKEFFQHYLKDWINSEQNKYESFRGGIGIEFSRIKSVSEFSNITEIIDFLKESIIQFSKIYPYIAANPESIFSHVVRAAPPWHETILEIALNK